MHLGNPVITSSPVGDGTLRLTWSHLPEPSTLREAVDLAVTQAHRVEVLLDTADEEGHRAALFAGLRREGVRRGVALEGSLPGTPGSLTRGATTDVVCFARLATDEQPSDPAGFRAMLNSFLPRKRVIAQVLVRDPQDRVLHCQLTYKKDWDLPGGIIEVGENPRTGALREVQEELALDLSTDRLLLTDWMPAWGGWDDAVCLVFDGGVVQPEVLEQVVRQEREIRSVAFLDPDQVLERAADFTARRVASALAALRGGPTFTESGRPVA